MTTPPPPYPGEILRVVVGSTLHGATAPDAGGDLDLMGVCIEPWQAVYGLDRFEQHQWRSQSEGVRSGPDDIDLTV